MDFGISGRRALVTGASSGIGKATAIALAQEGVQLVMAARTAERLHEAVQEVRGLGVTVDMVVADVTTAEGCREVVESALSALGGVDILINNAGSSRPRPAGDLDPDPWWEEALALNFLSSRRITEGLLPQMKAAGWGRIVTLTGAMAQRSENAATPAKAALWSWSRTLAVEVAALGITVNCIQPGRINTPQIIERLLPTEAARQDEIDRGIPIGRFGEPEELAALAAFLASEPARYITGTQIPVDGGMLRMALP